MALTVERVRVADILPLEDEYGNQFASRDYSLAVNREYVDALAASFGPSGEPDEPVKLVRDGGRFRIKTGNSRVRAMRRLGTEECWAVIDDEDTVQAALEAAVRTDVKKKYEEVELSRYVQQLAAFGDDEYVGGVSGIGAEKAGRMRRAREIAGGRAGQMTLGRMYALAEFDGDEDAVGQIMDCDESEWERTAARLRDAREQGRRRAELAALAARLRVPLADDPPEGLSYAGLADDAGSFEPGLAAACAGHTGVVGVLSRGWGGWRVQFYGEPMGGGTAEGAGGAERRRRRDEAEAAGRALDDGLLAWAAARLEEGLPMPALRAACDEAFRGLYYYARAVELFPALEGGALGDAGFAVGYLLERRSAASAARCLDGGGLTDWDAQTAQRALDWAGLHVQDGFEPDEGASALLDAMAAALGSEGAGE